MSNKQKESLSKQKKNNQVTLKVAKVPKHKRTWLLMQGARNVCSVANGSTLHAAIGCASSDQLKFIRSQMRLMVHSIYGTQEPIVKIKLIPAAYSLSGGLVIPVYTIQYSNLHDNSSWTAIFDEYKTIHGSITYEPIYTQSYGSASGGSAYLGVGVIDYEDTSAALANVAVANGHDTAKWFPLSPINYHPTTWDWHSQGQPDLAWTSTGTNFAVAAWKAISDQSPFPYSTTSYGRVHGVAHVQFRQIN